MSEPRPAAASEAGWNDYGFTVQMPHLAPGHKLSEVELFKMLLAFQWESIARALNRRPPEIVNDQGERLYGSVIDIELHLGERHSLEGLGEDANLQVRNQVRFYAKKFVEGLFVIDDGDIEDTTLSRLKTRADLQGYTGTWACATNAFIASTPGNAKLKVFRPAGAGEAELVELSEAPAAIRSQNDVQATGEIEPLPDTAEGLRVRVRDDGAIRYDILPESDMNGAGLLYFARYGAVMNLGERVLLSERLPRPVSTDLVSCLSTEHRKTFFFANAGPAETVEIRIDARLLPPDAAVPQASGPYRVPWKIVFRIDLHRASDKVLMASSLVRKSLTVPGSAKSILLEAERFLRQAV